MRTREFLMALPLAVAPVALAQCPATYAYQRTITVNSGQVAGTQSNFPMLVLNPTTSLKTTGNGGRVQNSNGYDIIFVNGAGTTLPFELVGHGTASTTYSPSTGNAEFWVSVASIADGTSIYMCYGNSGASTYQGNDGTTWAGRSGVWHMNETGASASIADASGNGHTGALTRSANAATGGGQIGSGFALGGGSDVIDLGLFPAIDGAAKVTVSAWIKVNTGADYVTYFGKQDAGRHGMFFGNMGAGDCSGCQKSIFLGARTGADNHQDMYTATSAEPMTAGTWHYLNYVFDGTQPTDATKLKAYVDGTQIAFPGAQIRGPIPSTMPASTADLTAGWLVLGAVDEMHAVVGTADSANWVVTEYRNQSNPSAFYSVGPESPAGSGPGFTISPNTIPSKHSGNITLTLLGTGTAWTGSTVFGISGVAGVSKIGQTVTSATTATLVVTTGSGSGSLAITESVTGSSTGSATVSPAALAMSPPYANLNSIQTVTLTGTNTLWTKETAAGLFALSGGTAASIGTLTVTSDTTATVAITVGTAAGPLTITDTSTGAVATLTAGATGGGTCAFVWGQ
jgi:hypothetical protein